MVEDAVWHVGIYSGPPPNLTLWQGVGEAPEAPEARPLGGRHSGHKQFGLTPSTR